MFFIHGLFCFAVYKYQLAIWTGAEAQAATLSDVYCQIYGSKGDTGKRRLCNSKLHLKPFQLGQMDLFDIEAIDLGDIKKITLMMIAEEAKDNWHLTNMSLQQHPFNGEEFLFECDRWFDIVTHTQSFTPTVRNEGALHASNPGDHIIFLATGSQKEHGTSSSVNLMVFGELGQAGPFPLEHPVEYGIDGLPIPVPPQNRPFNPGKIDFFPFTINEEQIGRIVKIRLAVDNKGRHPRWFAEKVCVQNLTKPRFSTLHFPINDWFSEDKIDGELTKEFPTEYVDQKALEKIRYKIEIMIGPKNSAAVPFDVDCYAVLYGEKKHNSGQRRLKKNFESSKLVMANRPSSFHLTAVGIGDVTKVTVGHTCPDARFKFHVRGVTVSWDPNNKITFPCDESVLFCFYFTSFFLKL